MKRAYIDREEAIKKIESIKFSAVSDETQRAYERMIGFCTNVIKRMECVYIPNAETTKQHKYFCDTTDDERNSFVKEMEKIGLKDIAYLIMRNGIRTIEEFKQLTDVEIVSLRNVGVKRCMRIKNAVNKLNETV